MPKILNGVKYGIVETRENVNGVAERYVANLGSNSMVYNILKNKIFIININNRVKATLLFILY